MNYDIIIARYGEIGLKSPKIRSRFEKKLVKNIKATFECDAKKYGAFTKSLYIELKNMGLELKNLVFDLNIAEYIVDALDVSKSIEEIANKKYGFDYFCYCLIHLLL